MHLVYVSMHVNLVLYIKATRYPASSCIVCLYINPLSVIIVYRLWDIVCIALNNQDNTERKVIKLHDFLICMLAKQRISCPVHASRQSNLYLPREWTALPGARTAAKFITTHDGRKREFPTTDNKWYEWSGRYLWCIAAAGGRVWSELPGRGGGVDIFATLIVVFIPSMQTHAQCLYF